MSDSPKIENIKRHNGVAGQFSYSCTVTYSGEDGGRVEFVGSVYGAPIVMIASGYQIPVSGRVTDRIGSTLNPQWVRDFFTPRAVGA